MVISWRLATYNNKSRKGTYIYIWTKGHYSTYKYDMNVPIDAYLAYFADTRLKTRKKKGNLNQYKKFYANDFQVKMSRKLTGLKRQVTSYVKKVTKKPIKAQFRQGMASVSIPNLIGLSYQEIQQHYKTLFRPLVLDEQLLDILTKEENVEKIKTRLEHHLVFRHETGFMMGQFVDAGRFTIMSLQKNLKGHIYIDMEFTSTVPKEYLVSQRFKYIQPEDAKGKHLKRVELLTIFRKG